MSKSLETLEQAKKEIQYLASTFGHVALLRELHERRLPIFFTPRAQLFLVSRAAYHGRADILKALYNMGVDLLALRDDDDNTAMPIAALGGQIDSVKALKEMGLDLLAKNRYGDTPQNYLERSISGFDDRFAALGYKFPEAFVIKLKTRLTDALDALKEMQD
jgi:Ankyrin repeats (many copies)